MDVNYFCKGFLFGLFLGWLYLTTRPAPPGREAKTLQADFRKKAG